MNDIYIDYILVIPVINVLTSSPLPLAVAPGGCGPLVWSCLANVATVPLLPCRCLHTETISLGVRPSFSILGIQTKLARE